MKTGDEKEIEIKEVLPQLRGKFFTESHVRFAQNILSEEVPRVPRYKAGERAHLFKQLRILGAMDQDEKRGKLDETIDLLSSTTEDKARYFKALEELEFYFTEGSGKKFTWSSGEICKSIKFLRRYIEDSNFIVMKIMKLQKEFSNSVEAVHPCLTREFKNYYDEEFAKRMNHESLNFDQVFSLIIKLVEHLDNVEYSMSIATSNLEKYDLRVFKTKIEETKQKILEIETLILLEGG